MTAEAIARLGALVQPLRDQHESGLFQVASDHRVVGYGECADAIETLLLTLTKSQRELQEARAERDVLRDALTPSSDTKAAYIGEVKDRVCRVNEDGEEEWYGHTISWTAIKDTMKLIADHADRTALKETAK